MSGIYFLPSLYMYKHQQSLETPLGKRWRPILWLRDCVVIHELNSLWFNPRPFDQHVKVGLNSKVPSWSCDLCPFTKTCIYTCGASTTTQRQTHYPDLFMEWNSAWQDRRGWVMFHKTPIYRGEMTCHTLLQSDCVFGHRSHAERQALCGGQHQCGSITEFSLSLCAPQLTVNCTRCQWRLGKHSADDGFKGKHVYKGVEICWVTHWCLGRQWTTTLYWRY